MSELRAPDPTLTALAEDVLVTWWDGDGPPAVAHRFTEPDNARVVTYCNHPSSAPPIGSEDARWFAIPCRTCFPDAGPRGYSVQDDSCGDGCGYRTWQPDDHLAWQKTARVTERT